MSAQTHVRHNLLPNSKIRHILKGYRCLINICECSQDQIDSFLQYDSLALYENLQAAQSSFMALSLISQDSSANPADVEFQAQTYCQIQNQISGDVALLSQTPPAFCDINCASLCNQTSHATQSQCLTSCGCNDSLQIKNTTNWQSEPWTQSVSVASPSQYENLNYLASLEVKNSTSYSCYNQTQEQSCCNQLKAQECGLNDNQSYSLLLQNRIEMARAAAITVSRHIAETNYANIAYNMYLHTIIREQSVSSKEFLITVSYNYKNLASLLKVEALNGYEQGFQVTYVLNGAQFSYFVLLTEKLVTNTLEYRSSILSLKDFSLIASKSVQLIKDYTQFSGYQYSSYKHSLSSTSSQVINSFINTMNKIVQFQGSMIASAASAAFYIDQTYNKENLIWRVTIVDFNNVYSRVNVIGYTITDEKVRQHYWVFIKNYIHQYLAYQITVQQPSAQLQKFYNFDVITNPKDQNSFSSVILHDGQYLAQYNTTHTFSRGEYLITFNKVNSVSTETQKAITQFDILREANVVQRESLAAVSSIALWVLQIQKFDAELKTIETDISSSTISLKQKSTGLQWNFFVRQIEWNNMDSLYLVKIQYATGAIVNYYTHVQLRLLDSYQVSIINQGIVLNCQLLSFYHTTGSTTYQIRESWTTQAPISVYQTISSYNDVIGGPKITVSSSQQIQFQSNAVSISNLISSSEVRQYQVYTHPTTGVTYQIYINSSTVFSNGQIVSQNGGLKFILDLFSSYIGYQAKGNISTFTIKQISYDLYPNNSVYISQTKTLVTNDGIQGVLKNVTLNSTIQNITETSQYYLYEVTGSDKIFKIFLNNTVVAADTNLFITSNGVQGLLNYLQVRLNTAEYPYFEYATDQRTGFNYYIYPNNSAYYLNGTFVCSGGREGLAAFLSSQVSINYIQPQWTDLKQTTINGKVYYIYQSGVVIDQSQKIITRNGYTGLIQILQNISFPQDIVINQILTEVPAYQFDFNGEKFYIFQNQISRVDGLVVSQTGMDGFFRQIVHNINPKLQYEIITDQTTNGRYYIYRNGTVTNSNGLLICTGYASCLYDYLSAKAQKANSAVSVLDIVRKSETLSVKIYSKQNDSSNLFYVYPSGLVWDNKTGKISYIFSVYDFYENIVLLKQDTVQLTFDYQRVKVDNFNQVYLVSQNGVVKNNNTNMTFVCLGGVQGLIRYLTIQNITQTKIFNNYVIYESLNLVFLFKDNQFVRVVNNVEQTKGICQTTSKDLTYNCLYNYLSTNYYEQIVSILSESQIIQTFTHSNGTQYVIYPTGKVTQVEGLIVCSRGGLQCLQGILQLSPLIPQINSTSNFSSIQANITFNYNKYIDQKNLVYLEFSNGTIVNKTDGTFLKTLPSGSSYISYGSVSQVIYVTQIIVSGTNQTFLMTPSGDIYSKLNVFITNGSVPGLIKFLKIQSLVQTIQTNQYIFIVNQNLSFIYRHNPESIYTQSGAKICRNLVTEELNACLVNYLANNYQQLFGTEISVQNLSYSIYSYNNTFYYIYNNGTVLDTNNKTLIYNGGLIELQRYLSYRYNESLKGNGSGQIQFRAYNDQNKVQYWLYSNGTLKSLKSGEFILNGQEIVQNFIFIRYDTFTIPSVALYRSSAPNSTYQTVVQVQQIKIYIDQQRQTYWYYQNGTLINQNSGQIYTSFNLTQMNLILTSTQNQVSVSQVRSGLITAQSLQTYIYLFQDKSNEYYVFQNGTIVNITNSAILVNRTSLITTKAITFVQTLNYSQNIALVWKQLSNYTIIDVQQINFQVFLDQNNQGYWRFPNGTYINPKTNLIISNPSQLNLTFTGVQTIELKQQISVSGTTLIDYQIIQIYVDTTTNQTIWLYPNGSAININTGKVFEITTQSISQLIFIKTINNTVLIPDGISNNAYATAKILGINVFLSQNKDLYWIFPNATMINTRTKESQSNFTIQDISVMQKIAFQNITTQSGKLLVNANQAQVFNNSVFVYYIYSNANGGKYKYFPANDSLLDVDAQTFFTQGGNLIKSLNYIGTDYTIHFFDQRNVTAYIDQARKLYWYYQNQTLVNAETNEIIQNGPQLIKNLTFVSNQTLNIYPGNKILIDYSKQNTTFNIVIYQIRIYSDKNNSLYYLYPNGTFINVVSGNILNFTKLLYSNQLQFITFFNQTQILKVPIVTEYIRKEDSTMGYIVYQDTRGISYQLFENGLIINGSDQRRYYNQINLVSNFSIVSNQTFTSTSQYLVPSSIQYSNGTPSYILYIVNNQTLHVYSDGKVFNTAGNLLSTGGYNYVLNQFNSSWLIPGKIDFTQISKQTVYILYKDSFGNLIRLFPDGSLFNQTTQQFTFTWDKSLVSRFTYQSYNVINRLFVTDPLSSIVYVVYPDGTVWTQKDGYYVTLNGMTGLRNVLNVLYNVQGYQSGNNIVFPALNMTFTHAQEGKYQNVYDWNRQKICKSNSFAESDYCILTWLIPYYQIYSRSYAVNLTSMTYLQTLNFTKASTLITQQYTQVNSNQRTFNVYFDGTVSFSNGTKIAQSGGMDALISYLKLTYTNPSYTLVNFFTVYNQQTGLTWKIYNQSGQVTYLNNSLVCANGSLDCLQTYITNYIIRNYPQYLIGTPDGSRYSVFQSGSVQDASTKTQICSADGVMCLQQWLYNNKANRLVNYNSQTYYILKNGVVALSNGTFVVDYGIYGLTNFLLSNFSGFTFQNVVYNVYSNGTVTYYNGTFFCYGGVIGLKQKITGFTEHKIEGSIYYVHLNGSVYDSNYNLIATGGFTGLQAYLQNFRYKEYQLNGTTYFIFTNGTVTSNQRAFITTGGEEGLKAYISRNLKASYTEFNYQGFTYWIYPDGTVYLKNVLVTSGGVEGLKTYLAQTSYYNTTVDKQTFMIYQNGSVYRNSDNSYICSGGAIGLNQYLLNIGFTVANIDKTNYKIYGNGSVYLGNQYICSGGLDGLKIYISSTIFKTVKVQGVSYNVYQNGSAYTTKGALVTNQGIEGLQNMALYGQYSTIVVQNQTFRVYLNGTVTTVNGQFVTSEGKTGLEQLLLKNQSFYYEQVKYGSQSYRIYSNGTVTTDLGVFVTNGGVSQLQTIVQNSTYQLVNVSNTIYQVYTNGTIKSASGVFITNGGVQGLQTYLQQSASYQIISINGVSYYVYTNGTVTTDKGVFYTTGGVTGLQNKLQVLNTKQTFTANNITYNLDSNGTVTRTDGTFVTNGGLQGLQTYLQAQTPSTAQANGVDYKIYPNGTVTTSAGQFVTNGGQSGLQTYLQQTQYDTVAVNGTLFRIYANGTVTTDQGRFVTNGGTAGLQTYFQAQSYQTVSAANKTYYIYSNGTVKTPSGQFVTNGGISGLQTYLDANQYRIASVGQDQYYIYPNGTVTTPTGKFVTNGGTNGLQTYLQSAQFDSPNILFGRDSDLNQDETFSSESVETDGHLMMWTALITAFIIFSTLAFIPKYFAFEKDKDTLDTQKKLKERLLTNHAGHDAESL